MIDPTHTTAPFCTNCGSKLDGGKFCSNCGHRVEGSPESTASPEVDLGLASQDAEHTVWEGASRELSSLASGGRFTKGRYKLTNRTLYFEEGMLSTSSQQLPLWAVRDVDLKQSMLQKLRGVGTLTVHVEHSDYTGLSNVVLRDIQEPRQVRDLLNQHCHRERLEYDRRQQTRYFGGGR